MKESTKTRLKAWWKEHSDEVFVYSITAGAIGATVALAMKANRDAAKQRETWQREVGTALAMRKTIIPQMDGSFLILEPLAR